VDWSAKVARLFCALSNYHKNDDTLAVAAEMKTQWKDIPAVPTSQEFLDIVLSRTYVAKFFSATLCAHHTNVCYTTN
jgi:hypothetical protein